MSELPVCPECSSPYTYEDGIQYVCPECGHEWSREATDESVDAPLIVMNVLTWTLGIPLSILLCMPTFMMLTASTTYESPHSLLADPCASYSARPPPRYRIAHARARSL